MSTDLILDIPEYEGLYAASTNGNIWAYPKLSRLHGRWLKKCISRCGYEYVCLFNGKRKNIYVHRLVAIAFIKNTDDKPAVNHKDGNKLNNRVENLEWVTNSENKIHAFRNGITKMAPSQIEASRRNITLYNERKAS